MIRDCLMFMNAVCLTFVLMLTRILYKIQCYFEKDLYPKDWNIVIEYEDIQIMHKPKGELSDAALNNYTAQSVSCEKHHRDCDGYTVSLNFPFKDREKAYKAKRMLVDKFKKDKFIQSITDENLNKVSI